MIDPPAPAQAKPQIQPLTPLARGTLYTTVALLLLALCFGGWGLWKVFGNADADQPTPAQLQAQQRKIDQLEQRAATLARSDQISRDANGDLQSTLAERDEEIAGLRADVAFYERFVGATAQRRGLTVHELQLQPSSDLTWHFVATLTQNLNRGAVNAGRLQVSVEGTHAGKLQRLAWADLRQQPNAPGVEYSFKYFQQVEGDLMLPADFKPSRVAVRLVPQSGSPLEQSFSWADSLAGAPAAPAP
ncbi:DUF6776 family protein [Pseudoxanthomonas sp. CF125]|uniref:DUF6776 family protein n=1 Tax=Pseudoxanthomonas sp. CF125 TaxID=1855303 RepID=UPI00088128D0|nr:DUF6776 family protein [Pseudoxanthomonas sp. CF125]SDQ82574.1 hypothetical protein SAMN05216569_2203 [Pseudoxanthomonas sp. CF125]